MSDFLFSEHFNIVFNLLIALSTYELSKVLPMVCKTPLWRPVWFKTSCASSGRVQFSESISLWGQCHLSSRLCYWKDTAASPSPNYLPPPTPAPSRLLCQQLQCELCIIHSATRQHHARASGVLADSRASWFCGLSAPLWKCWCGWRSGVYNRERMKGETV